jgi:hypothetical protein
MARLAVSAPPRIFGVPDAPRQACPIIASAGTYRGGGIAMLRPRRRCMPGYAAVAWCQHDDGDPPRGPRVRWPIRRSPTRGSAEQIGLRIFATPAGAPALGREGVLHQLPLNGERDRAAARQCRRHVPE